MQAVSAIFSRLETQPLLGFPARAVAAITAAACLGVLWTAAILTPNPAGVGTHTTLPWLHLQPCEFLLRTGVPCPACGMTTSFSWFARGNLLASAYIQPMGLALAVLTTICFWTALYIAMTGKPVHRLMRWLPGRYYGWPLAALAVAGWGWKVFIHLRGIDGWH